MLKFHKKALNKASIIAVLIPILAYITTKVQMITLLDKHSLYHYLKNQYLEDLEKEENEHVAKATR